MPLPSPSASTNTRTLQSLTALGLTASTFLTGQTAATTYLLLPSLLLSPSSLLLRQWHQAHTTAQAISLPSSVALSTLFTYLSYTFHRSPLASARWRAQMFLVAAAMPLIDMSWAALLMKPVNDELLARAQMVDSKAEESSAQGERLNVLDGSTAARRMSFGEMVAVAVGGGEERQKLSSHQLVDVWGWLNLGRAVIMLAGAGCAVWGVVGV